MTQTSVEEGLGESPLAKDGGLRSKSRSRSRSKNRSKGTGSGDGAGVEAEYRACRSRRWSRSRT